ncbi:MAG TPA: TetR/AcrR family transcriptional regulator [Solirubrobacteraceae bacterium]|jgi:AcrR family transcriptional regulator|nr:TetR/AcrR family transcriptional regulator [Solirubrobacteraceae bacterium]
MPAAPPRPALRPRYDRRRREIADAAARVFAERGYHATSVAALLQETGLSAGALYHYVASRDDLLVAICDELLDPLLQRAEEIAAATERPPLERLRELLRAWLEHIARHLDHMRVFAQERHVIEREQRWGDIRAKRLQFERILDDLLAQCEQDGSLRLEDRRLALLGLLGMVNYTPMWFRGGGRLRPRQIADGYHDMLVSAYRGRGEHK